MPAATVTDRVPRSMLSAGAPRTSATAGGSLDMPARYQPVVSDPTGTAAEPRHVGVVGG
jgi:hypothetical protein